MSAFRVHESASSSRDNACRGRERAKRGSESVVEANVIPLAEWLFYSPYQFVLFTAIDVA